jgi:hypothetical protein
MYKCTRISFSKNDWNRRSGLAYIVMIFLSCLIPFSSAFKYSLDAVKIIFGVYEIY